MARVSRSVSCFETAIAEDHRLSNCCDQPRQWELLGAQTIRKCITSSARPEENPATLNYNRQVCTATFAALTSQQIAVWICRCNQPQLLSPHRFFIVPGHAQYVIKKSPTSPVREDALIQRCTHSSLQELNRVCKDIPHHFATLSLHSMQTCCKRARRMLKDDKFEWTAFVP